MKCLQLQLKLLQTSLLLFWVAFPQEQTTRREDFLSPLQDKSLYKSLEPASVPLESVINPEKYYVGPADIISVNIWMSPPVNFILTVTPEGTLIVPTVGEISVADKTLLNVKEIIMRETRNKYLKADITITLIKPRSIIVTITGRVLNEGLYTMTSVDRASKAVEEANAPARYQGQLEIQNVLNDMSTRNIILEHKDGSKDRVDIRKYLATKNDRWNPYLREGDVLVVPRKNLSKNIFGVYGEVNSPGRYEFIEGDSLLDAIQIGMGLTMLARDDSIEFSRLNADGTQLETQIVNLREVRRGNWSNYPLQAGDRIVVKARKEQREDYRVSIVGEILYPGIYPITKNRTHLSQIVQQAGGFTEFASLKSVVLNRRSVQPSDIEIERLLSARGGVPFEDSSDYALETELRLRKEIVDVDFEKLFTNKDTTQDVILQDEDYIIVPASKKTVYVFGQVVMPGHVPFVPGKDESFYIRQAGGFTERARPGDLKIIKEKTKQWLNSDETKIEAGDYIWVPKEPERSFAYYMTISSQAAAVLSVVIGIAVVIIQLTK